MYRKGPIKTEKIVASLLVAIFVLYTLFEGYKFVLGPKINITYPINGSTVKDNVVTVKGTTKNVSFIYLNDRKIYINEDGMFAEKLVLPQGYTIIKLSAEDRFKKQIEKRISIWRPLQEDQQKAIDSLKDASTTIATSTKNSTSTKDIIH